MTNMLTKLGLLDKFPIKGKDWDPFKDPLGETGSSESFRDPLMDPVSYAL